MGILFKNVQTKTRDLKLKIMLTEDIGKKKTQYEFEILPYKAAQLMVYDSNKFV